MSFTDDEIAYLQSQPLARGAEADESHGWWRVLAVDPPRSLEVQDGFADDTGNPNPDLPTTTMRVALSEEGGTTGCDHLNLPQPGSNGATHRHGCWKRVCAPRWANDEIIAA